MFVCGFYCFGLLGYCVSGLFGVCSLCFSVHLSFVGFVCVGVCCWFCFL